MTDKTLLDFLFLQQYGKLCPLFALHLIHLYCDCYRWDGVSCKPVKWWTRPTCRTLPNILTSYSDVPYVWTGTERQNCYHANTHSVNHHVWNSWWTGRWWTSLIKWHTWCDFKPFDRPSINGWHRNQIKINVEKTSFEIGHLMLSGCSCYLFDLSLFHYNTCQNSLNDLQVLGVIRYWM